MYVLSVMALRIDYHLTTNGWGIRIGRQVETRIPAVQIFKISSKKIAELTGNGAACGGSPRFSRTSEGHPM